MTQANSLPVDPVPIRINTKRWGQEWAHAYLCIECGTEMHKTRHSAKKSMKCSSCGHKRHGRSYDPIFMVRHRMIERCTNPKNNSYGRYGGRGIKVCDEWLNSPEAFFKWADSTGYAKGLQIDRIDNDGDYCPENCRWVTCLINNRNRPSTKLTIEDARAIRMLRWSGLRVSMIAKIFGISQTNVVAITQFRLWNETEEVKP